MGKCSSRAIQAGGGGIVGGVAVVAILDASHRLLLWDGKLAAVTAITAGFGIGALLIAGVFRVLEFASELGSFVRTRVKLLRR
jgi:hypothetical protein